MGASRAPRFALAESTGGPASCTRPQLSIDIADRDHCADDRSVVSSIALPKTLRQRGSVLATSEICHRGAGASRWFRVTIEAERPKRSEERRVGEEGRSRGG